MNIKIPNQILTDLKTEDRLKWLFSKYKINDILITSSFGTLSAVLLSIAKKIEPNIQVSFIDTGFHFEETWSYIEILKRHLDFHVKVYRNTSEQFTETYSTKPYLVNPISCCQYHKADVLYEIIKNKKIWVSGIQSYQTLKRRNENIINYHQTGILKFNPLIDWSYDDMIDYLKLEKLPFHPLFEKGFQSIGCKPCTQKTINQNDQRSGRWVGSTQTECGLHR